ncbi:MAG: 4-hydroxy-3-methylbut-2-enyl diphosphate reductase [Candidatus Curtissbacteria bacterium GW2011_GWC2_41_21]|nr:MAG: 4-hydroxy-3-methylbut-2-enyl diphosphate reductase [Candidatus Curtissbacteria bacterium GW2011_GWC2_41_21]
MKAYLVDDEKMVNPKWLVGVRTLGITSGASAPEHLVTRLVDFIKTGNPDVEVENLDVIKEEVKFPLPDDLVTLAQEEGKGALWVEKHRVATQR